MWKVASCFLIVFGSFLMVPFIGTSQNKYVVNIIQPGPVQSPQINTVTVSSENKNIVEWTQKPDNNILYFNIYRDAPDTGDGWIIVGKATYPGINTFYDASSFPNLQSYRYQVASMDKCGNELFNSRIHKTIKLNFIESNDDYALSWNPYEGFDIAGYNIYRGVEVSNLVLIDSTMATITQYDVRETKNDKEVFYQIEAIEKTDTLFPQINRSLLRRQAHSNICSNKSLASNPTDASEIVVYPNPMTIDAIITFPFTSSEKYYLSIIDLTGNTVYTREIFSGQIEIKHNNLKEGIYILQVASTKKVWQKLIIRRN